MAQQYEIVNGIDTGKKIFIAGEIVNATDIPPKSIKWLKDQGEIIKIDNAYKEKKLQEMKNKQEEE